MIRGIMNKIKTLFALSQILSGIQKDVIEKSLSTPMKDALELWNDIALGCAPWIKDGVHSCGVMQQLSLRLSILVSREIGLDVKNKAIEKTMKFLNKSVGEIVEYMTLYGGCLLRPIVYSSRIQFELIAQGNYIPTRFDLDKTLTGAVIVKHIQNGEKKYVLLEEHTFEKNNHTVKCSLYRNLEGYYTKVSLSSLPQTSNLTEEYTFENTSFPLIVEFRSPRVNNVDGSDCAVSLYSGAEDLIKDADEQYSRMIWEQKAKEAKIFIDRDLLSRHQNQRGESVETRLSPELKRVFVQIEGDASSDGKSITTYSPEIRTSAQNEAFQQILRRIELTLNVGKGTLSDMESTAQTATQYSGGRSELFAIVDKIEDEIEEKYHRAAEVFAHLAACYSLGDNNSEIVIEWNEDATRKDMSAAKSIALQELQNHIISNAEYRMMFFGESEEEASAKVPQITNDATPFAFG